jgi:hypothetical protein
MGDYAEAAYDGGFYSGNEGGRGGRNAPTLPKPTPCSWCGEVFPSRKLTKKHLRKAHQMKMAAGSGVLLVPLARSAPAESSERGSK